MFEYFLSREEFSNLIFLLQDSLNNFAFVLQTFFESVCIFLIFLLYCMALRVLFDLIYYFAIIALFFISHEM